MRLALGSVQLAGCCWRGSTDIVLPPPTMGCPQQSPHSLGCRGSMPQLEWPCVPQPLLSPSAMPPPRSSAPVTRSCAACTTSGWKTWQPSSSSTWHRPSGGPSVSSMQWRKHSQRAQPYSTRGRGGNHHSAQPLLPSRVAWLNMAGLHLVTIPRMPDRPRRNGKI